ncbi:hypothetical protein GGI12_002603 [Dipsacomyces acuminosporus]|nr:hypothetical protein GGI12_002603 [Dipsacomyces acuminosporus]
MWSTSSSPPNVEFRDASDGVLFQETLSYDYALEDVFYQYYPSAPRSLIFYTYGNIALPKRITLNELFTRCNVRELPVVVWVKIPVSSAHPQWKLVP